MKTLSKILTELEQGKISADHAEKQVLDLFAVSGSASWTDDKVIDFVNWYIKLHKLDFRYTLENIEIIESFKNGDDAEKWHCH